MEKVTFKTRDLINVLRKTKSILRSGENSYLCLSLTNAVYAIHRDWWFQDYDKWIERWFKSNHKPSPTQHEEFYNDEDFRKHSSRDGVWWILDCYEHPTSIHDQKVLRTKRRLLNIVMNELKERLKNGETEIVLN